MQTLRTGLAAALVGVAAWSTLVEPRLFTIRRSTVPLLAPAAAPLRVLQLSDLHLAPWQHRKIAWVRTLTELKPDLVILTGDMMGHRLARGPLLHALEPFAEAGVPVVFVHGSNDYYGPVAKNPLKYLRAPSRLSTRAQDIDNEALTKSFTDLGFINLNNAATQLSVRGSELRMFGLGDPHIKYHDAAKMQQALAALPATPNAINLGVVHAPYQEALNALLNADAGIVFAGHTHGGQVRVPGIGALTSNSDLPPKLARGMNAWYNAEHAAFLNVSAGLGASIYAPIRFACRPEASLIILEAVRDA